MAIPVSLPAPARELGPRQHRKLDKLAEDHRAPVVVGWDDARGGPILRLAGFPDGRYLIDRLGQLRPVA